jgi:hypothetical protein
VLFVLAVVAIPTAAVEPARPLLIVDQPVAPARLTECADDGALKFAVADNDSAVPRSSVVPQADLVAWGSPAEFGRGTYVVTADGSVLSAETAAVVGEQLEFSSAPFGPRSLPLGRVRGLVFHAPSARAARDRLFRSLSASADEDRDRLLLVGDDVVRGTLRSLDSRHADIETSVGAAKVELGRIAAVAFNPALTERLSLPSSRVVVGLADGSLVVTASPVGREQVRLAPVAASPAAADAAASREPWQVAREEIVFLQTFGGRSRYLSDLEPTGYKHVPYLELARDYRLDQSPGGGDLRAGGRRYLKGVGMHSTSRLTFPLAADHRRFAAEIAIDDETGGRGSVVFRVFVDTEERFRSEVVRGGDASTPIAVDVAGGKQLSLVVDFAEAGDVQDHAVWLNARLTQ